MQPEHGYTVQRAVDDWLSEGLDARSAQTVTLYRNVLKPVTAVIGGIDLRMLTAHEVRRVLIHLAAGHSSRTVTIAHNALTRACVTPRRTVMSCTMSPRWSTPRWAIPAGRAGR